MVAPIYETDKECAICEKSFQVTKTRSRLTMTHQDGDFCTYYKEVNPNYYSIWVCPHCGYAAYDSHFSELTQTSKDKVAAFLKTREVHVDYSGERTCESAIETFKLALFFGKIAMFSASRMAALYLRLAWLYRELEEKENELAALEQARLSYEQALLKERPPIGNMSGITVEYLIGELYRRTGHLNEALSYFGKIVSDRQAKMEPRILKMAREGWHKAKEEKKEQETASK
ncbi:MAG: DUF2225 domain-containing protein [Sporomusaceae bacterium]|nr:DUF2225 domain-containing protein [Sporomusaceae bacterium]